MIHLFIAIILNLLLKCVGILSDVMKHAAAIAPVRLSEALCKVACQFSCSIQMIFYRLAVFFIEMSYIFHRFYLSLSFLQDLSFTLTLNAYESMRKFCFMVKK